MPQRRDYRESGLCVSDAMVALRYEDGDQKVQPQTIRTRCHCDAAVIEIFYKCGYRAHSQMVRHSGRAATHVTKTDQKPHQTRNKCNLPHKRKCQSYKRGWGLQNRINYQPLPCIMAIMTARSLRQDVSNVGSSWSKK